MFCYSCLKVNLNQKYNYNCYVCRFYVLNDNINSCLLTYVDKATFQYLRIKNRSTFYVATTTTDIIRKEIEILSVFEFENLIEKYKKLLILL